MTLIDNCPSGRARDRLFAPVAQVHSSHFRPSSGVRPPFRSHNAGHLVPGAEIMRQPPTRISSLANHLSVIGPDADAKAPNGDEPRAHTLADAYDADLRGVPNWSSNCQNARPIGRSTKASQRKKLPSSSFASRPPTPPDIAGTATQQTSANRQATRTSGR